MRSTRITYGLITLCIILLVAAAYLLTNSPQVHDVLSRSSFMPAYRTNSNEVCLLSVYEGKMSGLIEIAQKASDAGVPLTIAVRSELFLSKKDADDLVSMGHCIALYGIEKNSNQSAEQWMQRNHDAYLQFKALIGSSDVLFLPYLGQYTKETSRFCERYGLQYLLYCKDSRTYTADSAKSFAQVLAQEAEGGDILYIALDGSTDFFSIAKYFREKKLPLNTVGEILFN